MPEGFVMRLSRSQAHDGLERIGRLATQVERRRTIAGRYSNWLSAHGRSFPAEPPGFVHAYLRYPLRVTNRPTFIGAAKRAGVDLGDWFVSPIHPVLEHLERWDYRPGTAPIADRTCAEIVNLPTNPSLPDQEVDRVITFLAQHVQSIH